MRKNPDQGRSRWHDQRAAKSLGLPLLLPAGGVPWAGSSAAIPHSPPALLGHLLPGLAGLVLRLFFFPCSAEPEVCLLHKGESCPTNSHTPSQGRAVLGPCHGFFGLSFSWHADRSPAACVLGGSTEPCGLVTPEVCRRDLTVICGTTRPGAFPAPPCGKWCGRGVNPPPAEPSGSSGGGSTRSGASLS